MIHAPLRICIAPSNADGISAKDSIRASLLAFCFFLLIGHCTSQVVIYNETGSANFAVDIYIHYGSPCSSTGFAYQGCVPTAPSSTNPYTLNSGEYLETVKVRCATTCTGAQVASAVCSGSNMNFQCGGSGPWYTVHQVDNEVRIAEQ